MCRNVAADGAPHSMLDMSWCAGSRSMSELAMQPTMCLCPALLAVKSPPDDHHHPARSAPATLSPSALGACGSQVHRARQRSGRLRPHNAGGSTSAGATRHGRGGSTRRERAWSHGPRHGVAPRRRDRVCLHISANKWPTSAKARLPEQHAACLAWTSVHVCRCVF